ncbi:hypothetical protein ACFS07_16330 [Undibacterium arcticum]
MFTLLRSCEWGKVTRPKPRIVNEVDDANDELTRLIRLNAVKRYAIVNMVACGCSRYNTFRAAIRRSCLRPTLT